MNYGLLEQASESQRLFTPCLIPVRSTAAAGGEWASSSVTCSIWVRKMLARDKRGLVLGSGEALASSSCRLNWNTSYLQQCTFLTCPKLEDLLLPILIYFFCASETSRSIAAVRRPSGVQFNMNLTGSSSYGPHDVLGFKKTILYLRCTALQFPHLIINISWCPQRTVDTCGC